MNVAAGPLLDLSQRVHHAWVGTRVGALEALVPVGGIDYTGALGGVLLHSHVGAICGIALGYVLKKQRQETTLCKLNIVVVLHCCHQHYTTIEIISIMTELSCQMLHEHFLGIQTE